MTLTCATIGGTQFQFQKGTGVSIGIIQAFSASSTYTINAFSLGDADTYICMAKNGAVDAVGDSLSLVTTLACKYLDVINIAKVLDRLFIFFAFLQDLLCI